MRLANDIIHEEFSLRGKLGKSVRPARAALLGATIKHRVPNWSSNATPNGLIRPESRPKGLDLGVTTREIVTNVGQAAAGIAEVATNIADVSEGSVQTGAASTQVLQSARSLRSESARLKTAVEKLLNVRAA